MPSLACDRPVFVAWWSCAPWTPCPASSRGGRDFGCNRAHRVVLRRAGLERPHGEAEHQDEHAGADDPPVLVDEAVSHDRQAERRPRSASTTATAGGCARRRLSMSCWPASLPLDGKLDQAAFRRPRCTSVPEVVEAACTSGISSEVVLRCRRRASIHSRVRASHGSPGRRAPGLGDTKMLTMKIQRPTGDDEGTRWSPPCSRCPSRSRRRRCRCGGACPRGRGCASGRTSG